MEKCCFSMFGCVNGQTLPTRIICTNNNWLYWEEVEWLLPQFSSDSSGAFDLDSYVDGGAVYLDLQEVRPVLYLSSDVMITGGTGTSSDPYILSK